MQQEHKYLGREEIFIKVKSAGREGIISAALSTTD